MGPMLDDLELCEAATEVTTVGGGVEVDVTVYTVTTPLASVDDCTAVTTVGPGVIVTTTVVGVWEGCAVDGMVLIGVDVGAQLA